jgi:hypothetical protein
MSCAAQSDGTLLHYVQDSGPDPTESLCDYPEVAGCDLGIVIRFGGGDVGGVGVRVSGCDSCEAEHWKNHDS